MIKEHNYSLAVTWTGNKGEGTAGYRSYERSHTVSIDGKPDIFCSSDPNFRGDKSKQNPEELFLASIATCHMLWYLHLCGDAGVIVTNYIDLAKGIMKESATEGGCFTNVTLNPVVTVKDSAMIEKALNLHHKANELCYIANSCNFQILHNPTCTIENA